MLEKPVWRPFGDASGHRYYYTPLFQVDTTGVLMWQSYADAAAADPIDNKRHCCVSGAGGQSRCAFGNSHRAHGQWRRRLETGGGSGAWGRDARRSPAHCRWPRPSSGGFSAQTVSIGNTSLLFVNVLMYVTAPLAVVMITITVQDKITIY